MWFVRIVCKMLLFVVTGTGTLVIAACYGVPVGIDNIVVWLRVHNSAGTPIEGLEVSLDCDGSTYEQLTDASGDVEIYVPEYTDLGACVATITDIDGADNGGDFATQTVQLNSTDGEYDVEMTEN